MIKLISSNAFSPASTKIRRDLRLENMIDICVMETVPPVRSSTFPWFRMQCKMCSFNCTGCE